MTSQSDEYRARAMECQKGADEARDPAIKTQFQELARQWREMAVQVDNRPK